MPVWTPDAQRLVWASRRPLNLYWRAADGTGIVERLTDSPSEQRPSSFTPNGKQLLLSEHQSAGVGGAFQVPQDLVVLSLEGKRSPTRLIQTMFSERNGEVSPDGRWLAYESDESGQFQIYVRPFPAVDEGRWQVSTSGGRQPLWARSGHELFYWGPGPDAALMAVPVEIASRFSAGTPVKLFDGTYYTAAGEGNLGRTYDASPMGAS
jgi:serine/threonine-protein kinase